MVADQDEALHSLQRTQRRRQHLLGEHRGLVDDDQTKAIPLGPIDVEVATRVGIVATLLDEEAGEGLRGVADLDLQLYSRLAGWRQQQYTVLSDLGPVDQRLEEGCLAGTSWPDQHRQSRGEQFAEASGLLCPGQFLFWVGEVRFAQNVVDGCPRIEGHVEAAGAAPLPQVVRDVEAGFVEVQQLVGRQPALQFGCHERSPVLVLRQIRCVQLVGHQKGARDRARAGQWDVRCGSQHL